MRILKNLNTEIYRIKASDFPLNFMDIDNEWLGYTVAEIHI